jgi:drug/metabolite transporter (DMT)-like permease
MKFLPPYKNKRNTAIFALITANIIWGAASPVFKLALENIPPFTLAYIRFFFSAIIIFPFAFKNLLIAKKDWFKVILIAVFGVSINITFFFFGLERAPAINAPVISSTAPVFLFIFSILFLKEKVRTKVITGIIISLTGVLIIIIQPILEKGINGKILGNLFFVFATFGAIGHTILSKKLPDKYSAAVITFWTFFIGAVTFFPLYCKEMILVNPLPTIDWRGWMGIIYGVFFSSLTAYFLFSWGLKKINAQESGLFTYIDPIAGAVFAILLLSEKLTPAFVIGTILVFTGIYISEKRIHYHPILLFRKNRI